MARVLIVEDNPEVAAVLADGLVSGGYEPMVTDAVAPAKRLFDREAVDLVLLDINLKDGSGHAVCEHIRAHPQRAATPVIMLTGEGTLKSKEQGFAAGADYYLTKPIKVQELLQWVKALLRRHSGDWSDTAQLGVDGLTVNPETRIVCAAQQEIRGLTAKEFEILAELARAAPKTVPREELIERIWGGRSVTNTLDVHIKSLRKKLGPSGAAHVVTVKGVGYRLE
jgi:DNA-binding response OmpR family regulator